MNHGDLFDLHPKIRQFLEKNPTSFFKVWNLLIGWRDEYYKDNMGLPDGFGLSPPHILLGCLLMYKGSAEIFILSKGKNTHNTAFLMTREPPLNPVDKFVEKLRNEGGTESFPRFDPSLFPFKNPLGALHEISEGQERPHQPVRRKRRCGEVSGQVTPEQKAPDRKSSKLIGVCRLGVGIHFDRKPCVQGGDEGGVSKVSSQDDGSD
jgi:hypothetical protein